jgi:dTDP-4-dehydrorhamnose reductase
MKAAEGTNSAHRMRVLIVGAAGQLGQTMAARLSGEYEVTSWTRGDVDLRRHADVRGALLAARPDAIVNCAGFNDVDRAEDEQVLVMDVNALAVGTMARAAAALDAVFVHFSSDFVFSGEASTPYTEQDVPEPRSVYAQSKLVGEWLAADTPKHYVLRVESLFGGPWRRSSVDRIADGIRTGQTVPVFTDRVVSPSFVVDVAEATVHLLRERPPSGLYHCVNSGFTTWFEVGREIARGLGKPETALKPVSVHDVKLRASRPVFAALDNRKLAATGFTMPTWQDAIGRYLSRSQ